MLGLQGRVKGVVGLELTKKELLDVLQERGFSRQELSRLSLERLKTLLLDVAMLEQVRERSYTPGVIDCSECYECTGWCC